VPGNRASKFRCLANSGLAERPEVEIVLQLIDALASPDAAETVRQLALWFTYLGLVTFVCHFLETGMFMWSGVGLIHAVVHLALITCCYYRLGRSEQNRIKKNHMKYYITLDPM
jgi:hypothetical protein